MNYAEPMPMNNVVLVGDTEGWVRAYNKLTGESVTTGGYPLQLTTQPYENGDGDERWWEPVSGTATQMTVAAGLMIVGVNGRTEEQTLLKAYQLFWEPEVPPDYVPPPPGPLQPPTGPGNPPPGGPPGSEEPDLDLRLLEAPASADPTGFTARVHALCRNCRVPITTTVSLKIDGMELPRQPVTFQREQDWRATVSWRSGPQPAGETVPLEARLDPENRVRESNESNNTARGSVYITQSFDPPNPDRWGSKLSD